MDTNVLLLHRHLEESRVPANEGPWLAVLPSSRSSLSHRPAKPHQINCWPDVSTTRKARRQHVAKKVCCKTFGEQLLALGPHCVHSVSRLGLLARFAFGPNEAEETLWQAGETWLEGSPHANRQVGYSMPGRVQDSPNPSIGIEGTSTMRAMEVMEGWQSLPQDQAFCLLDDKNLGAACHDIGKLGCKPTGLQLW
ncbi:hypothetical protein CORC01_04709 [Colletotrichum orchidophilum]|uniref:Uncharacterized protein n=1 Tax=Colletotrichum orchidophilum TaxID=1209926 RepID=A0A1G4BFI4_9PEZI|nr:uncharacterized protein CORC01_04709 [Colletotrichum orchidophilum]OHF00063.1 hypothetical protein CORC01_04709 [Colletotrichum orchidophilum]